MLKRVFVFVFLMILGATIVCAQSPILPDYKTWPRSFVTSMEIDVSQGGQIHKAVADFTIYFNSVKMDEVSEIVVDVPMPFSEELQDFLHHIIITERDKENDAIHFFSSLYQKQDGILQLVATRRFVANKDEFYRVMHMEEKGASTEKEVSD